jgi:alpha-tubulin suppressor-like RCC1 family protein
VWCWGEGVDGQLGNGYAQQSSPVQVTGIGSASPGAKAITAGGFHTCAILSDTTVRCWGYNAYGELGDGSGVTTAQPLTVQHTNDDGTTGPLRGVVQVRGGAYHTCAVTADGRGWCWGYNASGQLGNTTWGIPSAVQPYANQLVAAPVGGAYQSSVIQEGIDGLVALSGLGYLHTCGLRFDGTIWCWGANAAGQLGNGTADSAVPLQVQGGALGAARPSLAAGYQHTCVLMGDGSARCWGENSSGTLGDGTTSGRTTPVYVLGSARWSSLVSGSYHVCALTADGAVLCWGYNYSGQVGDGTTTDRTSPALVDLDVGASNGLLGTAVALGAGEGTTCALMNDGTVRCWGWGGEGNLGDGSTAAHHTTTPTPVLTAASQSLGGASALVSGNAHMCALLSDGTVWCWGRNVDGELGIGNTDSKGYATRVSGLSGVVSLVAGEFHTCALDSVGTLRCWGSNRSGQLGDGTTTTRLVPTPVSPALPAGTAGLSAGWSHTCALSAFGSVWCWGANDKGQLGDPNNPGNHLSPTMVAGSIPRTSAPVALAAGGWHTCTVGIDGTVWCWGDNLGGDLGNGGGQSASPVQVSGIHRWSACTPDYGHCTTGGDCCGGACNGGVCLRSDQCTSPLYSGFAPSAAIKTPASSASGVHAFLTFDALIQTQQDYHHWDYIWGAGNPVPAVTSNQAIVPSGYYTFERDDRSAYPNPGLVNLGCYNEPGAPPCPLPTPDPTNTCGAAFCCITPSVSARMATLLPASAGTWSHPNGLQYCPNEWVLRTKNGSTVAPHWIDDQNLVSLDIGNPVVQAFQLAVMLEALNTVGGSYEAAMGIDNFFVENNEGTTSTPAYGHLANGVLVQRYHPDTYGVADPQFAADAINWLRFIREGLHRNAGHPVALYVNFGGNKAPTRQWVEQVLSNVDGVIDEGGFTSVIGAQTLGRGVPTPDQWLQIVHFEEETQRHGVAYAGISQFGIYDGSGNPQNPAPNTYPGCSLEPDFASCAAASECCGGGCTYGVCVTAAQLCGFALDGVSASSTESRARLSWVMASYLMGKEHSAYTFSSLLTASFQQYGCPNWFPEYAAAVGTSCSSAPDACMVRSGSAYLRKFTTGIAIVNPDPTNPAVVTLPSVATYADLYGNTVPSGSYTIQPASGAVLVTTGGTTLCN